MRLNPGVTLAHADDVLNAAETKWCNAKGGSFGYFHAYIDAVDATYSQLRECFAEPDLAGRVRGDAHGQLLALDLSYRSFNLELAKVPDAYRPSNGHEVMRAQNEAFAREVEDLNRDLAHARVALDGLKRLAVRPGLPLIIDTNILIAWQRPDGVDWSSVLRGWKESEKAARLIVPLRVVDELDRQKYGNGPLAKGAGSALRFLQKLLDGHAGEAVPIREDGSATLEVWLQTEDRSRDADLAILGCASDLDVFRVGGARVVTGDFGMQLRAEHMNLEVRHLPEQYRKKATDGNGKVED